MRGYLTRVDRIEGITVKFRGVEVPGIVGPVDLTIPAGRLTGLTGPSGAGKSTLLRLLTDPRSHDYRGKIEIDGRNLRDERDSFAQRIGYVPQSGGVHDALTPEQAIGFQLALKAHEDRVAPEYVLRQLDLDANVWHAPIGTLSGGENKRVRAALELIACPRLLILDEPASGLDHERESQLLRLLKNLALRGCAVLVVTHNLHLRDAYDHVATLPRANRSAAAPRGLGLRNAWNALRRGGPRVATPRERSPHDLAQTWWLLRREAQLAFNQWPSRLALPIALLPLFSR
ncbi:MAG: ABC transporter ATP-binding protein [Pirellulales bacterium]